MATGGNYRFDASPTPSSVDRSRRSRRDSQDGKFLHDGTELARRAAPPANVHRLEAYCIENLLLAEAPLVQIVMEEKATTETVAQKLLKFHEWETNMMSLIELFVAFAVLNRVAPEEPIVKLGVGAVITQSSKKSVPKLDDSKVKSLTAKIVSKIEAKIGTKLAAGHIENVKTRLKEVNRQLDIVSGKNFLFPLLEFHFAVCTDRKYYRSSIRYRLARHSHPERFSSISIAIARAASGQALP